MIASSPMALTTIDTLKISKFVSKVQTSLNSRWIYPAVYLNILFWRSNRHLKCKNAQYSNRIPDFPSPNLVLLESCPLLLIAAPSFQFLKSKTLKSSLTSFSSTLYIQGICKAYQTFPHKSVKIWLGLPTSITNTLIRATIISHLDYCNSLPAGLYASTLNLLKSILNPAAGVSYLKLNLNHIISHWLFSHGSQFHSEQKLKSI